MAFYHWKLFHYSLPFKEPLILLGREVREREGLILRLHNENERNSINKNFGEGEIAPLSGMHPESLLEAENQILDYLSGNFNPDTNSTTLFKSVNFGLDMALRSMFQTSIDSEINNSKQILNASDKSKMFDYKSSKSELSTQIIPVNGLAVGSGTALKKECEEIRKNGFKTAKLKVGQLNIFQDIERVRLARQVLGNEITLSLDANRAWDWDEALEFAEVMQDYDIEYCEEPLIDSNKLEQLHQQTGMPLALDETLWHAPIPNTDFPAANISLSGIKVLILKPGILGGWDKTKMWIEYAQKNGIHCILSSCFESGMGLNWIAFMAKNLLTEQFTAGLDTSKWFEQDLIEPRFSLQNGNYVFPESWPLSKDAFLKKIADGTCEIGDLEYV